MVSQLFYGSNLFLYIVCRLEEQKDSEQYLEEHNGETCRKIHEGYAGSMEVESINMFLRFEELSGVKYVNYIGEGKIRRGNF